MCEACRLGKSSKLPFLESVFTASRPLERIHCDVWGPAPVMSVQGFRYYVIFIDNFSRFCWIYPLKQKSDVFSKFKVFQQQCENVLHNRIEIFQSHGGSEFVNKEFSAHLAQCGIKHYISCPHTHEQNGMAERKHRHVTEPGLSMLFQCHLPPMLWVDAFLAAIFLINLLPTSVHDKMISPYEKLHLKQPDYIVLRVFGCACYPYLRPYAHNKFDPKSLMCVFLGYSEQYKGYKCLYPPNGRVYLSRHVLFDEAKFPFTEIYKHLTPVPDTPLLQAWYRQSEQPIQAGDIPSKQTHEKEDLGPTPHPGDQTINTDADNDPQNNYSDNNSTESSDNIDEEGEAELENTQATATSTQHEEEVVSVHPMVTRRKDGIVKPNPRYVMLTVKVVPTEPTTVAEALAHEGWKASIVEEMDTCAETETWSLVPPPEDIHLVGCRWVFKVKLNADGTVQKLRSRLVAKGTQQEEYVDFLETYSHVVRTATVRMELHLAVVSQLEVKQLDVKNAFLCGELHETVYMR